MCPKGSLRALGAAAIICLEVCGFGAQALAATAGADSTETEAGPVEEKCICFCVNPTLGSISSTYGTSGNFPDLEFLYTDITEDTQCAAKNNRACAGWDAASRDYNATARGFLTGCGMTTQKATPIRQAAEAAPPLS